MLQAKLFVDEGGSSGGVKIPVGIHSGAEFLGITTETTWSDINYGYEGRSIHKRLFKPTGGRPKEGETIQQALDRETARNLGQLVQVMEVFLGKDVVDNFEATDYNSFIASASVMLNAKKGTKVHLKVVPDWKEQKYPDLPTYGTYVEILTEGKPTTLEFSKDELKAIGVMELNRTSASSGGSAMASEDLGKLV